MENSLTQKKIIDLGKSIVKELDLDPGVDTLAKWMAHYIAAKIELAENLAGEGKVTAEKECFEAILKLWEHRWSIPSNKPFLKDFEPLLETLDKLNPNKEMPFYPLPQIQLISQNENKKEDFDRAQDHYDKALKVDRLARSTICELLHRAIQGLDLNGERGEFIRNAMDLIDYSDIRIIRFTLDYDETLKSKEFDEKNEKIEEIQKKIEDLVEFNSIMSSLLDKYKKELSEIEK